MFGKNETLDREYYWRAIKTSAIRIELIDQKTTTLKVGEKSENKNLPYPEASRVIITRSAQNNDLLLDYYQDDNRLAQERISGHTIASVSVEFPLPFNMLQQGLTMYDLIYAAAGPAPEEGILGLHGFLLRLYKQIMQL